GHALDVTIERTVPLHDGRTRIAARPAVGGSLQERDELTGALAAVVRLRSGAQRPAGVGRDGDRHVGEANAGDVVSILVRLGHVARIDVSVLRVVLVRRRGRNGNAIAVDRRIDERYAEIGTAAVIKMVVAPIESIARRLEARVRD